MKKLFFGMLAIVAMVATSCQQEVDLGVNAGETATVSFNVNAPASRAYSNGTTATVLQYAVYDADGAYLPDLTKTTTINTTAQVELQLVTGNTYSVIFWADHADAPYTVDFANKTMTVDYTGVLSNNEKLDAFYAIHEFTVKGAQTETIELRRPFAQLNIGTNDYAAATSAGYTPTQSTVTVKKIYNTLNLWDGNVSGDDEVTFGMANIKKDETFPVTGCEYLAMNYLLVPAVKEVVDIEFGYTESDAAVAKTRTVGSVPVQRNYRTNIYGAILTSQVAVNVIIKPEYEEDMHNGVVQVSNAGQFNAAFANSEVDFIVLTQDITLTTSATRTNPTLTVSAGEKLTIDLNGHRLTAETPQLFNVLGELSLINGTIENTATDGKVLANDADATLSNVTIHQSTGSAYFDEEGDKQELLAEGVVKVSENAEGAPTEIAVIASCGMSWLDKNIGTYSGFEGITIKLETDVDLSASSWNPIGDNRTEQNFKGIFDGQNHTIKGASKSSFGGSDYGNKEGWGIFSVVENATIKNLNIDNAVFGSYTVISGAVAGYANNTTFENINITNTKVAGYNWYTGGVVGWASGECTFKGINLDSTTAVGTLWDSHGQNAGGIAGGVSSSANITIEDCTISCVLDVINDVTSNYKWYIYRVAGMIIGNTNTTETKYNEVVTATATNVTCKNVTVNYGQWMNYHYCQGYWNRGWGRVESSDYVGGVDHTQCNHPEGEEHCVCIPFDQLFGGSSNGSGHYPVKGLREFPGVTVNYPAEYTCPTCGQQHNVK